jgi:hypothetical protein
MFHLDFQFVQDAAKNSKDPFVRADRERLEVHMAIVMMVEPRPKAAQVVDEMQTRAD